VALKGFEAGSFYPGRTQAPAEGERSDLWLSIEPDMLPASVGAGCSDACILRLDFIGRQTLVEGGYGHMGAAKHMIIVDRVREARVLE
jgi:hypothetical protein